MEGEIHAYCLNLRTFPDELIPHCRSLLDAEEQGRATRITHRETHRRFVLVRASLRALLGRYTSMEPADIRLVLGEKGKPRLAGTLPDQGLVFNVSHSGDYGLIAFAADTALGVDVEKMRTTVHLDDIAQRCFSPKEIAYWRALPADQRQRAFFVLWSFKEAFVKATGAGIGLGLESCVVDLSGHARLASIPKLCGSPDEWRLVEIKAGSDHSACACYHGKERKLRTIDDASLVNTLFNNPI